MAIVNEGIGEISGRRGFKRFKMKRGLGEVEGMGKRRFKIKKAIKKIAKKAVTVNKAMMKNTLAQAQAGAKIYMAAKTGNLNAALDAAKSGAKSYASLAKSVAGKKSGGGGGSVVDYVSDVQAAPDRSSPSVVTQYVDRVVNALPEAMTEEVEEKDESTGEVRKVHKVKPMVKYGMIGGGLGLAGLLAYLFTKRKK